MRMIVTTLATLMLEARAARRKNGKTTSGPRLTAAFVSFPTPSSQTCNQAGADDRQEAFLWTSEEIKIYTWPHGTEPAGLDKDRIDLEAWTEKKPSMHLRSCNIDLAFQAQKLLLDIAFCGDPVDQLWNTADHKGEKTCLQETKVPTCQEFVAKNPSSFKDVYFQIRDIRYFELKPETTSSTTALKMGSTTTTGAGSSSAPTSQTSSSLQATPLSLNEPASRSSSSSTSVGPSSSVLPTSKTSSSLFKATPSTSNKTASQSLSSSSSVGPSLSVLPTSKTSSSFFKATPSTSSETASQSSSSSSSFGPSSSVLPTSQTSTSFSNGLDTTMHASPFSNVTSVSSLVPTSPTSRCSNATSGPSLVPALQKLPLLNVTSSATFMTTLQKSPLSTVTSSLSSVPTSKTSPISNVSSISGTESSSGQTRPSSANSEPPNFTFSSGTKATEATPTLARLQNSGGKLSLQPSISGENDINASPDLTPESSTGGRSSGGIPASATVTTVSSSRAPNSESVPPFPSNGSASSTKAMEKESNLLTMTGTGPSLSTKTKTVTSTVVRHPSIRHANFNTTSTSLLEPSSHVTPGVVDTCLSLGSKATGAVTHTTLPSTNGANDVLGGVRTSQHTAAPLKHESDLKATRESRTSCSQTDVASTTHSGTVQSTAPFLSTSQSLEFMTAVATDDASITNAAVPGKSAADPLTFILISPSKQANDATDELAAGTVYTTTHRESVMGKNPTDVKSLPTYGSPGSDACSGPGCNSPTAATGMPEPESHHLHQEDKADGTGRLRPEETRLVNVMRCPPSATKCPFGRVSAEAIDVPCSGPGCGAATAPVQPPQSHPHLHPTDNGRADGHSTNRLTDSMSGRPLRASGGLHSQSNGEKGPSPAGSKSGSRGESMQGPQDKPKEDSQETPKETLELNRNPSHTSDGNSGKKSLLEGSPDSSVPVQKSGYNAKSLAPEGNSATPPPDELQGESPSPDQVRSDAARFSATLKAWSILMVTLMALLRQAGPGW